jgi:Fic family protein
MAGWEEARWEPTFSGPSKADRQGGPYRAYLPDSLQERPLIVDAELSAKAASVEAAVRSLAIGPESHSLEGLARFLLRSEAIASSRIEGLQVSPQQVALAELSQAEQLSRAAFSQNAQLVANNITALRQAATGLAEPPAVDLGGIDALHRALLPDEQHHGVRTIQNWIGGGRWNPTGAEYVPPPPVRVEPLMQDLVSYVNGGVHGALVQAALAHAQFETIHPYTDGNGRVGRALIHTVLTRRGLTSAAVLPVSLVLLTNSQSYVRGLNAYRYTGLPHEEEAQRATAEWLHVFLDAAAAAAQHVTQFADQLTELRAEWLAQLADRRGAGGKAEAPRANSAVARLLHMLPDVPLLTTATVQRVLGVSPGAAYRAVEELAEAQILSRKNLQTGTVGYSAPDIFELLTFTERRMASTRWDTRQSPPVRPVPARPQP